MSTVNLQLASLPLCVLCRSLATLHVRVAEDTPRNLRGVSICKTRGSEQYCVMRVPPLRARSVTWEVPSELWARDSVLLVHVQKLVFGCTFDSRMLDYVVWPRGIKKVSFGDADGSGFNGSLDEVEWPASLLEVNLGHSFNRPIDSILWPALLRHLSFGHKFNQSIDNTRWPVGLLELTLGINFNQSIVGVCWPPCLQHLTFGHHFDQPVNGVAWPSSLQKLEFGYNFNQSILSVIWPASLQNLSFGTKFNRPVKGVLWPSSLRRLEFGTAFNQSLGQVVWPNCLQALTLGEQFNQPLQNIALPDSLQDFRVLADSRRYSYGLFGVDWPSQLKKLTVPDVYGSECATQLQDAGVETNLFRTSLGRRVAVSHPT